MEALGALRLPEFPLLKRELLGLLRTQRAFWLLVGAVGLSSLVPLAFWPGADGLIRESTIGVMLAFL